MQGDFSKNVARMSSVPPAAEPRSNADIAPCLSVVVPVYNEESTVAEVLGLVLAQRPVQEVVVVDDCSSDGTWRVLEQLAKGEPRTTLLRHEVNRGKGAALRSGFSKASAPYVIVQDADLEYDPTELHLLLRPMLSGKADVVFGSRFIGAGSHRVLYFWHYVGNKLLTTLSELSNIASPPAETEGFSLD